MTFDLSSLHLNPAWNVKWIPGIDTNRLHLDMVSRHATMECLIWQWWIWHKIVAVVVEWLACLPFTLKIGVDFYLERESSATSGWINVGREWCCRGWSVKGGTPGGLLRTRDGLPKIRKAQAAHNVHECESVCAWNKNIVSAPKWLPCMNACMCAVFHCICICMCLN